MSGVVAHVLTAVAKDDQAAVDTLQRLGATSPAQAVPRAEFAAVTATAFGRLLARGQIREAAPGLFYVTDGRQSWGWRLAKNFWFWLLVISVPVLVSQWLRGP